MDTPNTTIFIIGTPKEVPLISVNPQKELKRMPGECAPQSLNPKT